MDPDIVLENLKSLVASILDTEEEDQTVIEMARSFQSLDEWISKGGFLPKEWRRE